MAGNIFDIQGLKIFCMVVQQVMTWMGGILDTEQELPDISEYDKASDNLEKVGFKVDYIITHCCSGKIQNKICSDDNYKQNALTDFFDVVMDNCKYRK